MTYYKDTWNRQIPDAKLKSYKRAIDNGSIKITRVTYVRSTQQTIVEYESEFTHEQVHDELRKRGNEA